MENNFDKYFKDKLENRKFEMKPEYWEGAEALIEADERSGWWRKFMMFFGMALFMGIIGVIVWKSNNSNNTSIVEGNPSFNNEEALLQNKSKDTKELKSNSITKNEPTSNSENVENGFNNISTNNIDKTTETNSKSLDLAKKNTKGNKVDSGKNKSSSTPSFSTTIPKVSTSKKSIDLSSKDVEVGDKIKTNTGLNQNQNQNQNQNSANTISNANSDSKSNSNNSNSINDLSPIIKDKIQSDESKVNIELKEENDKIEKDKKKEEAIANQKVADISTLNIFLNVEEFDKDIETKYVISTIEYPEKSKPQDFAFGVTGGAIYYPLVKNSTDKNFIGGKGGLLVEYQLNEKFRIGSELLYHFRSGNFVATKEEAVVQYSFGSTSSAAQLTPRNLHYLEMPIYLKYNLKKVNFEVGGLVSYLLGVRGEATQNNNTETGWIVNIGFRKVHTNAILGFHFPLGDKFRLGLRANYSINSILDKNAVLPNGDALRESGPLYLTLKLSQYIF